MRLCEQHEYEANVPNSPVAVSVGISRLHLLSLISILFDLRDEVVQIDMQGCENWAMQDAGTNVKTNGHGRSKSDGV